MFDIRRYTAEAAREWNGFVARSKNGTFLFDRGYMDYHSDRFHDHSLMFYLDGNLFALLPANAEGERFCSHRGLSYGGVVTTEKMTAERMQQLFRELNDYLRIQGFRSVFYKPVPHIFHQLPAEEDVFSLYSVCDARLADRSLSATVTLSQPLKWSYGRRYGARKARRHGVAVGESTDWTAFWRVLEENLMQRYGAKPVHTLHEMELLRGRFPEQIRLFTAVRDGRVVAGTVIYVTPVVVHTQYISASTEGKQLCALDALFDHVLHECSWPARYFDFGTSNGPDGHELVQPLIFQKEGFGGRGICYDRYEWTL